MPLKDKAMLAILSPAHPHYRWVIVIAAALILCIAMGMLVNGLSAFIIALETHFGWSRANVAAINSFGLVGIALGGVIMGFLADRFEIRMICLVGATVLTLALMLTAKANTLWQFYVLFFLAGSFGGGALFAPIIALVGAWFVQGRGLAIGIVTAGQGLGQGLVPFIAGHLIETAGWQNALSIIALLCFITLVPVSFLLVSAPSRHEDSIDNTESITVLSPQILVPALSLAVLGCCIGMSVPLMHLMPLIQSVCSVGAEAGGPLFIMLVAGVIGRVFFGKLADSIGPVVSWMAATAWQTIFMLGFVMLGTIQAFWLYAPLYGFGYGGVMTGVLVTTATLVSAKNRASCIGIVSAFGYAGHALGGWQGGIFFDLTEAYFWSFANAVIAGSINLLIIGTIWYALHYRTT